MSRRRSAPARGLVGYADATDPTIAGLSLGRALAAIVCRCVHPGGPEYPCNPCARFGQARAPALGRLLFIWIQGVPYGHRRLSDDESYDVGRLLEQLDRIAAGQLPRSTPGGDGL